MSRLRLFKLLRGGASQKPEKSAEVVRLDRFLVDAADTTLVNSLRQEDSERRQRRGLAVLAASLAAIVLLASGAIAIRSLLSPDTTLSDQDTQRAWMLIEQGWEGQGMNPIRAAEYFGMALEIAPTLVEACEGLAASQFMGNQIAESEATYRRCLFLDPDNKKLLSGLGDLYAASGRPGLARPLWEKAGRTDLIARLDREKEPRYPRSRSPHAALGWRLLYQQRFQESVAAFDRALAEEPRGISVLHGKGWSLMQSGRPWEARQYFERFLELRPNNPWALKGLAFCLKGEGRVEEAIALWERLCELYPDRHWGYEGLAWIYYERGDYQRAVPYLSKLARWTPEDPELVNALATAVQQLP